MNLTILYILFSLQLRMDLLEKPNHENLTSDPQEIPLKTYPQTSKNFNFQETIAVSYK